MLQSSSIKKGNFIHGKTESLIYRRWAAMMQRCYNKNNHNYFNYGGRGILVCESWHKFENFYADMGDPPNNQLTLDRIDNNKGYSRDNCRWATKKEQGRNKRTTLLFNCDGEKKTLLELAEKLKITPEALQRRLKIGLEFEEAISLRKYVRPSKLIEIKGKKNSLTNWAKQFGISRITVRSRLRAGWPIEKALAYPIQKHRVPGRKLKY